MFEQRSRMTASGRIDPGRRAVGDGPLFAHSRRPAPDVELPFQIVTRGVAGLGAYRSEEP